MCLNVTPRPDHPILFGIGGDENQGVGQVWFGGQDLGQVKQNGNARAVVIGAFDGVGRLIVVGHDQDLLGGLPG